MKKTLLKIGNLEVSRAYAEQRKKTVVKGGKPVVIGVSGNAGQYGYADTGEYLQKLAGSRGRSTFDQMRRSDPQVKAVLNAVSLPIRQAVYFIDPVSDKAGDVEKAELMQRALLEGMRMTWDDTLRHALLMFPFGFSVLEKVWEIRDGLVMPRKLDPRLPQSIIEWKYDRANDHLIGPIQIGNNGIRISLPIDKLLVFTTEREGDNWEGISLLRPAYKPWYIKDKLEKINAIKHDRYGAGIPVMKGPSGIRDDQEEWDNTVSILEDVQSNEQAYIIEPGEDWNFRIEGGGAKSGTDVLPSIKYYDEAIARVALAQFIMLGSTDTGSRALGDSFLDLFLMSLQTFADQICEVLNRFLIREWVGYNWGDQKEYPILKVRRIQKLDPTVIATLKTAGVLTADIDIEKAVRDELNLPAKTEEEKRPDPPKNDPPKKGEEDDVSQGDEEDTKNSDHTHGVHLSDRQPNETERLVNFSAIEMELDTATASLKEEVLAIRENQIEKVLTQLVGGKKIQNVTVPQKRDMFDALKREFKKQLKKGCDTVFEEITRQRPDLRLATATTTDLEELLKLIDEEIELQVEGAADKLKTVIAKEVVALKKKGLSGDELMRGVSDRLKDRLSERTWTDLAAGAINRGNGVGRNAAAESFSTDIDYCMYSALLDRNTCGYCSSKDGAQHEYGDQEYRTPNPECQGGGLCRCLTVYVMKAERNE